MLSKLRLALLKKENIKFGLFLLCIGLLGYNSKYIFIYKNVLHNIYQSIADSSMIKSLSPYHSYVKTIMAILVLAPSIQILKLYKNKTAEDISLSYYVFTILIVICINLDFFRDQYNESMNFFMISLKIVKNILYTVVIFLILKYRKQFDSSRYFFGLLVGLQLFFFSGIFLFPKLLHIISNNDGVEAMIVCVLSMGMLKPMLQTFRTVSKGSAKDVSIIYLSSIMTYLFLTVIDSVIFFNINHSHIPVNNITANFAKGVFYLITISVVSYYRLRKDIEKS